MTTKDHEEAKRWLAYASDDLDWARDTLERGHFPQACFVAQQVAEKSVKALCCARGVAIVKGHSVLRVLQELQTNGEMQRAARKLDQYYITPRYPDALPGSSAREVFTEEEAAEALGFAELIISRVRDEILGG